MSHFETFGLYLALSMLIFAFLTFRVIAVRRGQRISLGDGDDNNLRKRIRSQANFVECTPLAMLGLLTLAFLQVPILAIHIFGAAFLLGRLLHAHGMMQKGAIGAGRPLGMMITLLVVLGEALYILYSVIT